MEPRPVPTGHGVLAEAYRRDWFPDTDGVDQIFQVLLEPGAVTAWHLHARTTDRLFASTGLVRLVLYDSRSGSETHGVINEFLLASSRPGLVVVPPGIWHGVENVSAGPSLLLNITDLAYEYEAPDHWSLPQDCEEIPYRFGGGGSE